MNGRSNSSKGWPGFTIVELLIVIVVIAILAAIATIAYRGFYDRAEISVIDTDLTQAAKQLSLDRAITDVFPADIAAANGGRGLASSNGIEFAYTNAGDNFCLSAFKGEKAYSVTKSGVPTEGACPGHSSPSGGGEGGTGGESSFVLQTTSSSNCPTGLTRAYDARDNRSYWIKKLGDGKCWMLTNLAYAGGGNNTYGDVKTVTLSTNGAYGDPRYYIPAGANPTSEPNNPSTSTDGTGQYGYLYNWCAAMGGQATLACANAVSPVPNVNVTICPAGWRLPTSNYPVGDFINMVYAVLPPDAETHEALRTVWLGQYAGLITSSAGVGTYTQQGYGAYYWSSTYMPTADSLYPAGTAAKALSFASFSPTAIYVGDVYAKYYGFAIRCMAD